MDPPTSENEGSEASADADDVAAADVAPHLPPLKIDQVIKFDQRAPDDCLDLVFCPLIDLYLRVGALIPRDTWVLTSLSAVASSNETDQGNSTVVIEVPYSLLNTIIPPDQDKTKQGETLKKNKKSATTKFRRGLHKTAGFFIKAEPAPHKLSSSFSLLSFGRHRWIYMASLELLCYRLIALPPAHEISAAARTFAAGLGPSSLIPQLSAILASKGLGGSASLQFQMIDASISTTHALGRPSEPTGALTDSQEARGSTSAASSSGAPINTLSGSSNMAMSSRMVPLLPTTIPVSNQMINAKLNCMNFIARHTMAALQHQLATAHSASQTSLGLDPAAQSTDASNADSNAMQQQIDQSTAGAHDTVHRSSAPKLKTILPRQPGTPVVAPPAIIGQRPLMPLPVTIQPGMLVRPFVPPNVRIAPRGSLMSRLLVGAQRKATQMPAIALVFQLQNSGFPRAAQYLLAICASKPVATAGDLLFEVTEEQLQHHLTQDQEALIMIRNGATADPEQDRHGALDTSADPPEQWLRTASALFDGAQEVADPTTYDASLRRRKGKKRASTGKGKVTNDDNMLQQLATAAAMAQRKADDDDDDNGDEAGNGDGDESHLPRSLIPETVNSLIDWLSQAFTVVEDDQPPQQPKPKAYPWGRRGRASLSLSAASATRAPHESVVGIDGEGETDKSDAAQARGKSKRKVREGDEEEDADESVSVLALEVDAEAEVDAEIVGEIGVDDVALDETHMDDVGGGGGEEPKRKRRVVR